MKNQGDYKGYRSRAEIRHNYPAMYRMLKAYEIRYGAFRDDDNFTIAFNKNHWLCAYAICENKINTLYDLSYEELPSDLATEINNLTDQVNKTYSKIMHFGHPLWPEFCKQLYENCEFKEKDWSWKCNHTFINTKKILMSMPEVDVKTSIEYFKRNDSYCDCDVFLNMIAR